MGVVALVVRFDLRDEAAATRFDELTAEAAFAAHEQAAHVVAFHTAKEPLLAGAPRVELLVPGVAVGEVPA